ncbi:MAG: alpha/beta hydrolase family protein [Fimbriiglobus sp.]
MLSRRAFGRVAVCGVCAAAWPGLGSAQQGQTPGRDRRLGPAKTLNDDFSFTPPKTLAEWQARREFVRNQVKVALGLWPMPEKTPLKPVVHGKIDRGEYTVEKVYFASVPGHYVSGNLYRPTKAPTDKKPAVLFAHGHWNQGRFQDDGEAAAKRAVERGEESDVARGRFFMQALPATLAKLGFVVFHHDMIGYAESTAIAHILKSAVAHPEGFADVAGELRLQSLTGLQTWNSIRGLDFLETLPDVDASRMAITGASGGGTQTFLLAAVDDRVQAAFPAVMVSTAMQGGCVCENASYLRLNTGNIELSGVFAPKPMAMSGANDWTKEIMTKGLPELRQLYKLHGAEEKVAAKAWVQFPHNYGQPSREFMYTWFRTHLMKNAAPVKEDPFEPIPVAQLKVFDTEHPRPKDELRVMELRNQMAEASDQQLAATAPAERANIAFTALQVMMNTSLPKAGEVTVEGFESSDVAEARLHRAKLSRKFAGEAVPTYGLIPPDYDRADAVVWLHPDGEASMHKGETIMPAVQAFIDAKFAVLGLDAVGLLGLKPEKPFAVNKNYAGFSFGYNRSLLAERVHDVLTAVGNLLHNARVKRVSLVGFGELGPVALLAKVLLGDVIHKTATDLNQFRFESITSMDDPMMQPGAIKYGGLPGFFAAAKGGDVLIHNHPNVAKFRAEGTKVSREVKAKTPTEVARWLTTN